MANRAPHAQIDAGRLIELVDRFEGLRIAVFGDLIVDEFIYGEIARVSREAPVLILNYDSTEIVPGGAGNAANNVAALGGSPVVVGVAGRDEAGDRLVAALEARASVAGIVRPRGYRTPTKTRILAGGIHSAKQQVVRIDRAATDGGGDAYREAIEPRLMRAVTRCDAMLVSDYGSGLVSPKLVAAAQAAARTPPRTLVDSRYALLRFRGMTTCTPNESEVEQLLGVRIGDNMRVLERAGRELLERTRSQAVLITRGSRGMALFERGRPTVHIPIYGSDQIADVTGAGDTVIATMTLALAAGAAFEEAARLANYAGGLVVMKRGTATVSADELRTAILTDSA
ncbi:MAG TPA: PfkB family carbohydrate kinase [Vicinamibacterales bacterium]|nr:PfkB family carbohydrate kinase [Vicinamibacterales bacterium]